MGALILIIDDDPALLESLSALIQFRIKEAAVEVCHAAEAALDRIRQTDYDAIVSDIKMPQMDGLALMEHVQAIRPTTPTLLITGHGDDALAVHSLNAGAYAFIKKPIERDFFVAWLQRAIQLRRLSRDVEETSRLLAQQAEDLERTVAARTAALLEHESVLRLSLQAARAGAWRVNLATSEVHWSPELYAIIGLDSNVPAELERVFRAVHPDDYESAKRTLERSVAEKSSVDLECRFVRPDGEVRWVIAKGQVSYDETGHPLHLYGLLVDITERKRIEEQLRMLNTELERRIAERTQELEASNRRLRLEVEERRRAETRLLENERQLMEAQRLASFGSWRWDVANGTVWWSPELCRVYGIEPEAFEGTYEGFMKRCHPDDRDTAMTLASRALEDKRSFTYYHRVVRQDGAVRVLYSCASVVTDDQGRVIGMFGACQDVTPVKEMEEALLQLQHTLDERITGLEQQKAALLDRIRDLESLLPDAERVGRRLH